MLENSQNISEKVKGNAISAYLMIFISGLFLLNKENPNINNNFVKSHTKTAMLIHLGFLITYIIFISNNLFAGYSILGFGVNIIITDIIYIFLLILLISGIYKASKGKTFNISNDLKISKTKNILDIDGNGKVTEKDKITILLSYVPFIGFINFAKYRNNKIIQNSVRLNITISLIISLFFIFGYINLATIFSLIYIVFITFIGINLFSRDELININLPTILSPSNLYIGLINIIKYIKNYFDSNDFKGYSKINQETLTHLKEIEEKEKKELETKKDLKLPKFLIYIPVINLIFLFYLNTKYFYHIINGLVLTFIFIKMLIQSKFGIINPDLILLLLFPISFGIGYSNNKLVYKMPIIFDIYNILKNILTLFKKSSKTLKEKKSEEKEINLKVKK